MLSAREQAPVAKRLRESGAEKEVFSSVAGERLDKAPIGMGYGGMDVMLGRAGGRRDDKHGWKSRALVGTWAKVACRAIEVRERLG